MCRHIRTYAPLPQSVVLHFTVYIRLASVGQFCVVDLVTLCLLCRNRVGELEAQRAQLHSQLESHRKEAVLRELELFKKQQKKPGILKRGIQKLKGRMSVSLLNAGRKTGPVNVVCSLCILAMCTHVRTCVVEQTLAKKDY